MATVGVTSSPVLKPVGPTLTAALAGTAPTAPPTPAAATTTLTPGAPPVTTAPTAPKAPIPITMDVPGPKTNALASSLLQNAYGKKHDSPLEVIGGLAQVLAGTKAQREFETAEKARERLPTQQIQEYAAGGGGFGVDDAESLIATGVPALVEYGVKLKAAQAESALKPPEREKDAEGNIWERGGDGQWHQVTEAPYQPKSDAGQLHEDWIRGALSDEEYAAEVAARRQAPYTEVGKILADVKLGNITEATGNMLIDRATAGWTMVTDPAQRAALGINPADKRPFQLSPEKKLEPIDVPATFSQYTDGNGTIWNKNDVTGQISVAQEGDKPKLPNGWRWTDASKTTAEIIPGIDPEFLKTRPENPLTERQSIDLGFYARGRGANRELGQMMADGRPLDEYLTGITQDIWSSIGTVGNFLKTPEEQMAWRAGAEFLAIVLRKDSGAAVTDGEFALYKPVYLPMIGDSQAVLERKRAARETWLRATRLGLGPASKYADEVDKDLEIHPISEPPGAEIPGPAGPLPKLGEGPIKVPGGTIERID